VVCSKAKAKAKSNADDYFMVKHGQRAVNASQTMVHIAQWLCSPDR